MFSKLFASCVACACLVSVAGSSSSAAQTWVRVNQVGYLPDDPKVAVLLTTSEDVPTTFAVCAMATDTTVLTGTVTLVGDADRWKMKHTARLDFSDLKDTGKFYVRAGETTSPAVRIGDFVYRGGADFLLNYMRQQRCGDNPYTTAPCHLHDGFITDHPTSSGMKIDVTGGWHDATDYLQYTATSATALTHLMFAWLETPDKSVFRDEYDKRGRPGPNNVPDIVDEIRYGLTWLLQMNPEKDVMFNQIADDRDHSGMRLPQDDKVDYGYGPGMGRPVYFVTGEPQQAKNGKNRTTGVSSTAGKFAAAFALGAQILDDAKEHDRAEMLRRKAAEALAFGEKKPGNTQTACVVSPYFYEEDNFADDMELGAAALAHVTKGAAAALRARAAEWGDREPISPWIFQQEKTGHYQYYPFVNLGHYYLAQSDDPQTAERYRGYMRDGLAALREAGRNDAFLNGVPFIWCSNNLVSAAITQARLYHDLTGDAQFVPMETALRDWLLGCNPWGTSMIVGWPRDGISPQRPHSSYVPLGGNTPGGLVDGPVYRTVFEARAGKSLTTTDPLAVFNHGIAVYHDDLGDYASNEPTMDGTAGLAYYFARLASIGGRHR